MSIQSGAGAESAAKELKTLAEKELLNSQSEETKEVLNRLIKKATEIIKAAKSGWY